MASLSQGRTAAAQCGLFTYTSVPVIFEPPCILQIPTILNGTALYYFILLPQLKDNVELSPSSSRSFSMFFYALNVSAELTSVLFPVFLHTTCRLSSDW